MPPPPAYGVMLYSGQAYGEEANDIGPVGSAWRSAGQPSKRVVTPSCWLRGSAVSCWHQGQAGMTNILAP